MIKMKDLRQGNLVLDHTGAVVVWDKAMLADGNNVLIKIGGSEITIDPIALTEEWLQKFGIINLGEVRKGVNYVHQLQNDNKGIKHSEDE